jgi:oligopeptide transport system permease protein
MKIKNAKNIEVIINRNTAISGFWSGVWQRFVRNKLAIISLILILIIAIMCILVPLFGHYNYATTNFSDSLQAPNFDHLFGTDGLGRDLFVRTFIGGRVSFEIALAATLMVLVIGVFYGSIAGYSGGNIDAIMMRIVDVFYGIPFLFFSILLLTIFGQSIFVSIIAIAVISWLDMARVVRGQTLSIKEKEFISAAVLSGLSNFAIIRKHIIPNLLGVVIVYATLVVPNMIILSAVLSFFGLGVMEPMTSWGLLISDGAANMTSWWLIVFPAGIMVITLLAFAYVANGIRDALDPR